MNALNQQTVTLQLDIFEGPLDLLLYLIKKNDLEISRISLSQVTDQYLQYLSAFDELNIDTASEFLLIAAELTHIKSKSLLPNSKDEEQAGEEGAIDIIARLKEYQAYKSAADVLAKKHWLGRDVYKRGEVVELEVEEKSAASESFEVDTFDLISAFSQMINRLPKEKRDHQVMVERISVTDRIYEVLESLKNVESALFTELFPPETQKIDYVITFLAVLEMARLKMIRVFQTGTFEPIRLQRRIDMENLDQATAQVKDDFK